MTQMLLNCELVEQRFLRDERGPALPDLELPLEAANRKCKVTVTNKVHKYVDTPCCNRRDIFLCMLI